MLDYIIVLHNIDLENMYDISHRVCIAAEINTNLIKQLYILNLISEYMMREYDRDNFKRKLANFLAVVIINITSRLHSIIIENVNKS